MPGLVGIVTRKPRAGAELEVKRMLGSLLHEPSYVSGTWQDEGTGVYAGWVARAGSFASSMPWQCAGDSRTLLFSGEEYTQSSESKSSHLLSLSRSDPQYPLSLNGRFHGLLVDRAASRASLFNDRFGIHRLYVHQAADALYFAAEAKAILAVRPELRRIDPQGMGDFISCGCVLENRTLFHGIEVLPPASRWTIERGSVARRERYFNPEEWESQPEQGVEDYYASLRETFAEILPRYFEGPESVAMSLTGGLDSRMIMAWRLGGGDSMPCYSFGGMFRDCHDVRTARRVAKTCGLPHSVIPLDGEYLSRFAHYAERTVFLSDGCVDTKHSADLYVNERAAGIAPARMTGNYGGEVLRQVRAFKPMPLDREVFTEDLRPHIDQARQTYQRVSQCHPLSFAVFRQAPWHHYGLLSLEQTQVSLRSPYLDNEFVRAVYRSPAAARTSDELSLRLIGDGNPALLKIATDRGLGGSLPGPLAAANHALSEFSFKAEYAYDYGMPQFAARIDHALSGLHLERLFLGRHKFYHFRTWYKNQLAGYVREILLDPRTLSRPYLRAERVRQIVERHLDGGRNHTLDIHKLLTVELQHRLFIDAN